jgi:DNA-binding HxlR family transcriptional regulator
MAQDTRRDIAWNRTLTRILEKGTVRKNDLMKGKLGVGERTAADVLNTMEGMGWIQREPVAGPKPDAWKRGDKLPATISTEQA